MFFITVKVKKNSIKLLYKFSERGFSKPFDDGIFSLGVDIFQVAVYLSTYRAMRIWRITALPEHRRLPHSFIYIRKQYLAGRTAQHEASALTLTALYQPVLSQVTELLSHQHGVDVYAPGQKFGRSNLTLLFFQEG